MGPLPEDARSGKYGRCDNVLLLHDNARPHTSIKDEGDNCHTQNYPKKKAFFTRTQMQGDSNGSEANSVIGLLSQHAIDIEKSDWIVDSGAICHMCHDMRKFINFKKLDITEDITLGDGFSVEALGIETIELNISVLDRKYERCRPYETLHAPKLSYNLRSVSEATKSGKPCYIH